MKNSTSKLPEINIYVESRSGNHRFIAAVYPFKKETRTACPDEYDAVRH